MLAYRVSRNPKATSENYEAKVSSFLTRLFDIAVKTKNIEDAILCAQKTGKHQVLIPTHLGEGWFKRSFNPEAPKLGEISSDLIKSAIQSHALGETFDKKRLSVYDARHWRYSDLIYINLRKQ